jgi:heat shock protein 4
VNYNGEQTTFTPQQLLAMLFTQLKNIVFMNNPGVPSIDAVISVPAYYTDAQRHALKDAAAVAGVNCLRLMHEGTAAALSYGIYKSAKKEFPEGRETKIMFLDMGHSAFNATVAAFTNGSLRVLASASDPDCGGRDIDVAIAKQMAAEFKAKYNIDAWANRKARIKLLVAAEKAKISISPFGVNATPVSIECLLNDRDYNGNLTIEKMDELVAPLLDKMGAAIKRAMALSGTADVKELAAVELVGGSMRPRVIKRKAAEALGLPLDEANAHGLSQSMNLDEAVARGCALQCAMLSPVFKVKEFSIIDSVSFPIRISWDPPSAADSAAAAAATAAGEAMDIDEDAGAAGGAAPAASAAAGDAGANTTVLFKPGDVLPLTRRVTFRRSGAFDVVAEYDAAQDPHQQSALREGANRLLGRYTITGFPADAVEAGAAAPKIRVDFKLDLNGIFSVSRAELLKEIKEASPAASADGSAGAPMDTSSPTPGGDAAGAGGDAPKKKRFKKVELAVVPSATAGLSQPQLDAFASAERKMIKQDADIHATQDARNTLETYIYNTRNALGESLETYSAPAEREGLEGALGDMETWLYGDGFEADRGTYEAKLKELQARGNPLFARKYEAENRGAAGDALLRAIDSFRAIIQNREGKHGHLSDTDHDTMRAACSEAESWYRGKQEEQGALDLTRDPVLRTADINAKRDALVKELMPIASKPVPPPPAPAAPPAAAPAPAPAPAASPEATEGADGAAPAADKEAAAMDVE